MDNHKYIFLGMLITFLIIIILGIININFNFNNKIYVKEVNHFYVSASTLERKIKSIEDEECSSSLMGLLERIKDTYYEDNISVKEYYENYNKYGKTYYSLFQETLTICDLDIKNYDRMNDYLLASRVYPDAVADRYKSSYEIKFVDYFNYKNIHELTDNVGTYSSKKMELMALSELIGVTLDEESL